MKPALTFAAIDFETANQHPGSACAVGIVRVEAGKIVAREHRLIRPPEQHFEFTYLHGIAWEDVKAEPAFKKVWPDLHDVLNGVQFLAAHWAQFDEGVLRACCARSKLKMPAQRFVCTVELARAAWKLKSAKLPIVCRHLKIQLQHHNPLSDAEACARIVLAAQAKGMALY